MADLSTLSDEELLSLAKKQGVIKEPTPVMDAAKTAGKFGVGVTQGMAEMVNVPAIPGAVERIGRTAYDMVTEPRKPNEGLLGKLKRVYGEADKESVFPQPTVAETAAGIRSVPGVLASPFTGKKIEDIYGEELAAQKDFTDQYSSKAGETTGAIISAIPSVIQFGKGLMTGVKAGGLAARAALQKGKQVMGMAEEAADLPKAMREVLQQVDGEIVEAIIKRPEKVKQAIQERRFSVEDLSKTLQSSFKQAKDYLGQQVGKYRTVVLNDREEMIPTEPFKDKLLALDQAFRQNPSLQKNTVPSTLVEASGAPITREVVSKIGGQSTLSPKELKEIDDLQTLVNKDFLSPREALQLVDKMQAMADPVRAEKGAVSPAYSFAIRDLRRDIKDSIRGLSPELDGWQDADNAFVNFTNASDKFVTKLNSFQRDSFVSGLLNKNKDPVLEQLNSALEEVAKVGVAKERPDLINLKNDFFNNLADIKAAQGLKARELGTNDPMADNIARIIAKYEKMGERTAGIAGGLAGMVTGGQIGPGTGAGGSIGGLMLGTKVGGLIGRKVGERMADPMRILEMAKKAKDSEVVNFAKDLEPIVKELGSAGLQAILTSIGPNQVVNKFLTTTQQTPQGGEK